MKPVSMHRYAQLALDMVVHNRGCNTIAAMDSHRHIYSWPGPGVKERAVFQDSKTCDSELPSSLVAEMLLQTTQTSHPSLPGLKETSGHESAMERARRAQG